MIPFRTLAGFQCHAEHIFKCEASPEQAMQRLSGRVCISGQVYRVGWQSKGPFVECFMAAEHPHKGSVLITATKIQEMLTALQVQAMEVAALASIPLLFNQ